MQETVKKSFDFKRLVVAVIILPLLITFLYFTPPYPYFFILLIAVSTLALREFHVMYRVPLLLSIPSLILGVGLFYLTCFHPFLVPEAIFIFFFIILLLRLLSYGSPAGAMSDLGPIGFGYLYIPGFLVFQWLLMRDPSGLQNIFMLYTAVWLADSAAYYVGTYLGKHKLALSVSPNKTYEGLAGSMLGGVAGALIISYLYGFQNMSPLQSVMAGAVLGTVAVAGDLIESMFKRDAGVKDSGCLLPGHGGLLDKLDGVLVAGPVLYFMLRFF